MHERRLRPVVDLFRRADLLDLALVHHHHAVGDFQRFFLVVGDENRGDVDFLMQRPQPLPQFLAHLRIQRAERFVEQQDARLDGEGARKRDALALAARELARIAVGEPAELHEVEQFVDTFGDGGLVRPHRARLDAQAECDILEHVHVAEQRVVLEDEADMALAGAARQRILAVEADAAGVRPFEAGDDAQKCRLAGAGRSQQRQQLAAFDPEVDIVERREVAEALDDIADFNGHCDALPDGLRERS